MSTSSGASDFNEFAAPPVYYRLYMSEKDNKIHIVCMQYFDEGDYNQLRFINDERYDTEQEADDALTVLVGKSLRLLSGMGYKVSS